MNDTLVQHECVRADDPATEVFASCQSAPSCNCGVHIALSAPFFVLVSLLFNFLLLRYVCVVCWP